jgi:four helix bundle protein
MEVVSQSHLARRQGFLDQETFQSIYNEAEAISRMLSGLRASLMKAS